jgi:hypothetical protein
MLLLTFVVLFQNLSALSSLIFNTGPMYYNFPYVFNSFFILYATIHM